MNENKRHLVTSDFFTEVQSSKLFFNLNVVENPMFGGYDILVNQDTQESKQIMQIAQNLFAHEERYTIVVDMIGINNILRFAPTKLVEAIERRGLENLDEHLNGIVGLEQFDKTFSSFSSLLAGNKNKLKKYSIIYSPACWTCLIKHALRMRYKKV